MNSKEELIAKIKEMPIEDVVRYESAAINIGRALNILGVGTGFVMLMFPTPGIIIAGAIFAYLFANISVDIKQFLGSIREILKKKVNN